MKRSIVASILGIAVSLAAIESSDAAGYVYFDNYFGYPYNPVRYASVNVPPGTAGQNVGPTFQVALYAGVGVLSNPNQLSFVNGSIANISSLSGLEGYFYPGPLVVIPNYNAGPITFMMVAWNTAGPYGEPFYNFNPTTPVLQGISALWTEASIDTSGYGSYFLHGPPEVFVQIVPEPSTLALALLGSAALWMRRSR